jgi:DNA repair protein RadC
MRTTPPAPALAVREALAPYVNLRQLRRVAAMDSGMLTAALTGVQRPAEVLALLDVLATLLRPTPRESITGPHEVAALLLVEMSMLSQEQLRVVCLNTKNYVQAIHLVYQGSVNSAAVRLAEVFREPMLRNSAAIIVVQNHPSGDATPSPEDVAVTRQIVAAGKLLDGEGRWVSLLERRQGFES